VFLSEPITAEQMRQWNVVNKMVDDADLETQAAVLAQAPRRGADEGVRCDQALWRMEAKKGVKGAKAKLYDLSMPTLEFPRADAQRARDNQIITFLGRASFEFPRYGPLHLDAAAKQVQRSS
jgi:enoyl-CoA hydratase/carnithine racemase